MAATASVLNDRPPNSLSAKEMQRRSVASRRLRAANRKAPANHAIQEIDYNQFVKDFKTRTQFMLNRCCLLFDKAKSGNEAEKVASAIIKLFDVWADLTMTPKRGILRPDKLKEAALKLGMKRALTIAMTTPDPTTPNAAPESPTETGAPMTSEPAPNTGDLSPQIPAAEPMPNVTLDSSTISPTSHDGESILKHSFSPEPTVPAGDTPTPAIGMAGE